jgi:hypothetical protein
MRFILFGLAILSASAASGESGNPLVALVQRSQPSGLEELSVTLFEDEARLVSNSNFTEPPGPSARLGVFVAPMNEDLRTERTVLASDLGRLVNQKAAAKALGAPSARAGASPHETRWMINGNLVDAASLYRPNLSSLLARAWGLAEWKAREAVDVSLSEDATHLELRYSGKSERPAETRAVEAVCTARRGPKKVLIGYLCRIDGFGTAYLQPKTPPSR